MNDDNSCCPICFDDKLSSVQVLPCGHKLCVNCYDELISIGTKISERCPLCRLQFRCNSCNIFTDKSHECLNQVFPNNVENMSSINSYFFDPFSGEWIDDPWLARRRRKRYNKYITRSNSSDIITNHNRKKNRKHKKRNHWQNIINDSIDF